MELDEVLHTERQREILLGVQVDERAEEVIPRPDEAEDSHCCEGGPRHWQHNAEEDRQFVRAVNAGGVRDLLGNSQKELAQEEDIEGRAQGSGRGGKERRHPKRLQCVDPVEMTEN